MARKSVIARDKKREQIISKFSAKRDELREIVKSSKATLEEKLVAVTKLQKLPRNSSKSRLNRRCNQCGRPKGVYRKFGICRLCLRKNLMVGQVPGGRKSSW